MQGNGGKLHHFTGLGTLPDAPTPPSCCPCSYLQLLLLEMGMTTILALPLASGSQAKVSIPARIRCPPSLSVCDHTSMVSNGGQGLQRARQELGILHRSVLGDPMLGS